MQIKNIKQKYSSVEDIKAKLIKNKNDMKYFQLPTSDEFDMDQGDQYDVLMDESEGVMMSEEEIVEKTDNVDKMMSEY